MDLEVPGKSPKVTGKVRHDNKNKHIKNRNFKKGDEGEISELAFETGVPELGKINRWKTQRFGSGIRETIRWRLSVCHHH